MAIETPNYDIVKKDGNIELREYSGYITATIKVEGTTHNKAGSKAFSILADYIFGNNIDKSKISMTAPVVTKQDVSSKIAMTAPVTISAASSNVYEVSFTMPAEYTMDTIPKPNNESIKLEIVKLHRAVAIKFSGYSNEDKLAKKTQAAYEWINENKLTPKGEPLLARYDPPWKPGIIRRNEIIVTVE